MRSQSKPPVQRCFAAPRQEVPEEVTARSRSAHPPLASSLGHEATALLRLGRFWSA